MPTKVSFTYGKWPGVKCGNRICFRTWGSRSTLPDFHQRLFTNQCESNNVNTDSTGSLFPVDRFVWFTDQKNCSSFCLDITNVFRFAKLAHTLLYFNQVFVRPWSTIPVRKRRIKYGTGTPKVVVEHNSTSITKQSSQITNGSFP